MISNERPSPYSRRPQGRPQYNRPAYSGAYSASSLQPAYNKPPSQDTTIRTERIQVERKTFVLALKENDRGRFLRITEESKGHRDMIIVPSTGLEDFNRVLSEIVATPAASPSEQQPEAM